MHTAEASGLSAQVVAVLMPITLPVLVRKNFFMYLIFCAGSE